MDLIPKFRTLISECIKGDSQSQKQLFLDYYGHILLICKRYNKTNCQAEESANDTFIKVFDNLSQYDFNYPFRSWISKIAVNTCIDAIRKNNRTLKVVELKDDFDSVDEDQHNFEFDLDVEILPIIQELPPAYRLVFNLYVFEEYKHHEIAAMLNISIGTSKSNYSRAKGIITKNIICNPKYEELKSKMG